MSAARAHAQDAIEDPPEGAVENDGSAAAPPVEPGSEAPDLSPEAAARPATPPSSGPTIINVHERGDDEEEEEEEPAPQSPFDPHELEGESYHHVGVFARGIIAPQFIQNLFVDGGVTALNVGVGGFYNYRKDGLNIIAEVWWAGFYGTGPFKALNEEAPGMEMIESELSVVFGNIVLMWSIPIASWLAIEIGFGLGFGGVFGGMYRTEAYRTDGNSPWTACTGPGNPAIGVDGEAFCDPREADGGEGHYQRLDGPQEYNFSGGVPPLWFWVDLPRVAVRIKPLRQLQIRVEGGFAAYAFHFGGSLAFGF